MKGGSGVISKVHKRCTWLNANVFWAHAIDEGAIEALSSITFSRAMEICKEIEEKAGKVTNPSGYLIQAVKREQAGAGDYGGDYYAGGGGGGRGAGWSDYEYDYDYDAKNRIHRRCTWLNGNIFWKEAITEEAIEELAHIHPGRAMEMLKELEEKACKVSSPTGFLVAAVRREGAQRTWQNPGWEVGAAQGYRHKAAAREINTMLHRRSTWLNANVFWLGAIDEEAIAELSNINFNRAMEMLAEVEAKCYQINNPAGYLKNAVRREGQSGFSADHQGGYGADYGYGARGDHGWNTYADSSQVNSALHRRCTWLNANVFWQGAIDWAALAALSAIDVGRALDMLKDVEAKADSIGNPSGYLKNAVQREGSGGELWKRTTDIDTRIQKRCTWLNVNVFVHSPIDRAAVEALCEISYSRAMEICKTLEEKGSEHVANPSGYLKAAVQREHQAAPEAGGGKAAGSGKGKGKGKEKG